MRRPAILFEGKILDGRNRCRASGIAGVDCPMTTYDGIDPVGFVVSLNLRRRHLNEGQRAWVAAQLANIEHGGDRRSDQAANLPLVSQADAAAMLNVSERSLRNAAVVRDHGAPELQEKVAKGEIAPSLGADIARRPIEEQREIAANLDLKVVREVVKQDNAKKTVARREEQLDRIAEISKGNTELPTDRRYPIIYAGPPWRYKDPSIATSNRSIENHYPTMSHEEICALPVREIATDDALLYLWTTAPKVAESVKVIEAWGFEYCTSMVWDKRLSGWAISPETNMNC